MAKKQSLFGSYTLLIKEMFYAFLRKNKVFYKISGIDRYLSSCSTILGWVEMAPNERYQKSTSEYT